MTIKGKFKMKNLHIENSYNIWSPSYMKFIIDKQVLEVSEEPVEKFLNRKYWSLCFEWWLHNIGYWVTLPLVKFNTFQFINDRCKHVDLEAHFKNVN